MKERYHDKWTEVERMRAENAELKTLVKGAMAFIEGKPMDKYQSGPQWKDQWLYWARKLLEVEG